MKVEYVGHLREELLLERGPDALGDVGARGGTALLSRKLKRTAEQRRRERGDVCRRVREHKVLAARLADNAWITLVLGQILSCQLPQLPVVKDK